MIATVYLITGSKRTKVALTNQLRNYIGSEYEIKAYAVDCEKIPLIKSGLVILSSRFIQDELNAGKTLGKNTEIIVAKRTIDNQFLSQIVEIPINSDVLFVNELPSIVYDVISYLKELGITHINYHPYYPGIDTIDPNIKIAITPGEIELVPKYINKIYDIGPRLMDFTTITKILNKLGILDENAGQYSQKYLQTTIAISKKLADSKDEIMLLNQHLEMVIDGFSDGMLVYDKNGKISVSNEIFKKIINSGTIFHKGRNINEILFNKELLMYLQDENNSDEKIFKVNGIQYMVSKATLNDNSLVAKFKSINETISISDRFKREMIKKGLYAKYSFEDIIGKSKEIAHVKKIAKKLAKSNLTMLIYGESGTGKELFASAIHNESTRKNGPFLAVNFSALSDNLLESELFGYDEGAFTGAKKGGKIGLFEQAQGGTIFLDEIGDISLKMQARLLRVLQEKEIMRIGGSEIIPVDVRIIAATNKNLYKMVNENKFREDLYHRLKMGYIILPPLRDRKEDIPELIKSIVFGNNSKTINIENEVVKKLCEYNWGGNVRELKNTLEYMIALSDGENLSMESFPDSMFFQNEIKLDELSYDEDKIKPEYLFLLKRIYYYNRNNIQCGRNKLSIDSECSAYKMTQHQVRTKLIQMVEMGFIEMSKGKRGTTITKAGLDVLNGG